MLRVYCSWPGVSATMKLAAIGREEAIGDVDRDALFALRFQPVDEQGEVHGVARRAELLRVLLERDDLVVEQALGIIQKPPDEGRLAVIDAAAGEEAQRSLVGLGTGWLR